MSFRIVVISDSHGNTEMIDSVIAECAPFDMFIHCGDGIKDLCTADIPENSDVLMVAGNTDRYSGCDVEEILTEEIYGRRVMVTHGHKFNVKTGLAGLIDRADHIKAAVILFGHTHEPFLRKGSPLLFNPGSLSNGNFGVIHASEESEWFFEHRKIKKG